jgi:hypothetical protein
MDESELVPFLLRKSQNDEGRRLVEQVVRPLLGRIAAQTGPVPLIPADPELLAQVAADLKALTMEPNIRVVPSVTAPVASMGLTLERGLSEAFRKLGVHPSHDEGYHDFLFRLRLNYRDVFRSAARGSSWGDLAIETHNHHVSWVNPTPRKLVTLRSVYRHNLLNCVVLVGGFALRGDRDRVERLDRLIQVGSLGLVPLGWKDDESTDILVLTA